MTAGGAKRLCVFSSVAGDRARKPVILYGAAKAGLSHYLTGLDHKFAADGLKVTLVKPGFVKTAMTAGLPVPPFAGEPSRSRAASSAPSTAARPSLAPASGAGS
jgi:NAD(P)-dependent dehydrogenase (short-subunit alcohol dehydrogenase family)